MKKKVKIQSVSSWSIAITLVFALIFAFLSIHSQQQFQVLQDSTQQYIVCEKAAKQVQDGCDYLVEQSRLYAMTGDAHYMSLYFKEAQMTQRREHALEDLSEYFDGTQTFTSLQSALRCSDDLMQIDYYAMRLTAEATELSKDSWPDEVAAVTLSEEDANLTSEEKLEKAQSMLCDSNYQALRIRTNANLTNSTQSLLDQTDKKQGRAETVFSDTYRKLEIGVAVLILLMLAVCIMVRRLIVKPLISYNESIKLGEIFPVIGAAELQNLATTYNQVYQENQETQKLIRHQAEHDALTDILNRGSFEKILNIYEEGDTPFALILVDVDVFKSVNDTYGHAVGDIILKNVANYLKTAFRSIDYVCRIGGDEFAIIMVEMTSDLQYTIKDKIDYVNEQLSMPEEGIPKVSLSVGAAFSDRENPGESIFKDADKALYHIKENGRNGCGFY